MNFYRQTIYNRRKSTQSAIYRPQEEEFVLKKMILVTSPPACGKTYISKQLAKNLKHVVYLDKDTLIVLSNRIFDVAGEERNRSSDFF